MKTLDMHNVDFEKIARFLAHEMERIELQQFRQELTQNSHLKAEVETMKKIWINMNASDRSAYDSGAGTDTAWENLTGRLEKDGLLPTHKKIEADFPGWLKIAASVLLVVTIGVAAWFIADIRSYDNLLTLTTDDGYVTFVQKLDDGSVVYMASNSVVRYPKKFENKKRKLSLSGEAFFDVKYNPEQPFYVETSLADIEVMGTSFNVKEQGLNSMEVFVETGKVKVNLKDRDGSYFLLEQGELLKIHNGMAEKSFAADTYNTAWRKNHMQFKDETVENILSVLTQNFPLHIIVEDSELNQRRLTVTFYNTSPEIIGEIIAVSLGIEHETSNDNTITFKSRY